MNPVVRCLGAFAILTFMVTSASALEPNAICDKAKTKAVSKQFQSCMKCLTKNFADTEFDDVACRQEAEDKCVAAFAAADTKGAGACLTEGNGPGRCDLTDLECGSIYAGI
jgi:hypothetical protein